MKLRKAGSTKRFGAPNQSNSNTFSAIHCIASISFIYSPISFMKPPPVTTEERMSIAR